MQDLFINIMLVKQIIDTFPNPTFYTTPLGTYVELNRGKVGFFIEDVINSETETKLVSFALYARRSKDLFIKRIIGNFTYSLSTLTAKTEISASDLIEAYQDKYINNTASK